MGPSRSDCRSLVIGLGLADKGDIPRESPSCTLAYLLRWTVHHVRDRLSEPRDADRASRPADPFEDREADGP